MVQEIRTDPKLYRVQGSGVVGSGLIVAEFISIKTVYTFSSIRGHSIPKSLIVQ